MPRYLILLFAFLFFSFSSTAQYEILKLTGRTTLAQYYELRGDFLFYKRSEVAHAVVFSCASQAVADSVRSMLSANPTIALKEIEKAFAHEKGLFEYERTHFRRGDHSIVHVEQWQTGLTPAMEKDGKIVFADIRSIEPEAKLHKLNRYDLFSVVGTDGSEYILYDPDTTGEGDPSEAEVRNYIKGEQYAMAHYHKPIHRPAGMAVGLASVFALGFYAPPVVFAYAMGISRHNPRYLPPSPEIDEALFNSPEFKHGYQKYARNKKARQSLIWGGIGFAIGFPVFLAIFHE